MVPGDGDDDTFADVLSGFPQESGWRRKRGKATPPNPDTDSGSDREVPANSPVRGAHVNGENRAEPAMPPVPDGGLFDTANRLNAHHVRRVEQHDQIIEDEAADVRPYAITGGRTKGNETYALELETLITTRDDVGESAPAEHRSIVEKCQAPSSVAEIASALGVPFGVARVLISDAADAGLVTVHHTISGDEGAEEHLILMERVLSGLRRL